MPKSSKTNIKGSAKGASTTTADDKYTDKERMQSHNKTNQSK